MISTVKMYHAEVLATLCFMFPVFCSAILDSLPALLNEVAELNFQHSVSRAARCNTLLFGQASDDLAHYFTNQETTLIGIYSF